MPLNRGSNATNETAWFKSSYSNDSGGCCVEVARLTSGVGIRDSKNKQGPALVVPSGAWHGFIAFAARAGAA
ncbi:DUF397 domain-containing protein [Streptomyces albipurpureus]|uniref:DUF397 domain-containing protein n=1 Tax=Streptomyces albipurpureus TaxID=2897419 RepID=A0ABT0UR77_9ACTN|nr:DUF397 domain-containing protein [Streptomyces sp. CWNU-1]MCM2390130.1 DUF397 domain-containing protein [Streptomyces sp. CWNU-1]